MTVQYGARAPRRRDAQRNRTAILEAAAAAMTSEQATIGMPAIARRAGIGLATLYRHFPDRYALAAGVLAYQIERLEACVAATAQQPAAFRRVLGQLLRAQVTMRPLVLLARGLEPADHAKFVRRLTTVLAEPLRRAQAAGLVRGDLVPADLVLLLKMVEGVVTDAGDVARSIDLALNGVFRDDGQRATDPAAS